MRIEFSGHTDVGLIRRNNEDNFCILLIDLITNKVETIDNGDYELISNNKIAVFIVADGMGGMAAGEIASEIVVEEAKRIFRERKIPINNSGFIIDFLKEIISEGHKAVKEYSSNNPKSYGMGTTFTIALVHDSKLFIVWSGDSRCYRYAPNGVQQLKHYDLEKLEIITPDHSEVWEMVENGNLTAEEARVHKNSNIITQSLGDPHIQPRPDFRIVDLYKDDKILICSDGLNGMIDDFYISQIMSSDLTTDDLVFSLIESAKFGGGTDNITVVVAEVKNGNTPKDNKVKPRAIDVVTQKMSFRDEQNTDKLKDFEKKEIEPNKSGKTSEIKPDKSIEKIDRKKNSWIGILFYVAIIIGIIYLLIFYLDMKVIGSFENESSVVKVSKNLITKSETDVIKISDQTNKSDLANKEKQSTDKKISNLKTLFKAKKQPRKNKISNRKTKITSIQKQPVIDNVTKMTTKETLVNESKNIESKTLNQSLTIQMQSSLDSLKQIIDSKISEITNYKHKIVKIENQYGTRINSQLSKSIYSETIIDLDKIHNVLIFLKNQIENYPSDTIAKLESSKKLLKNQEIAIETAIEKMKLK